MSTARSPFDDEALRRLLDASRRRNHADDLTGMLLHAEGHFIQTLEGPEASVDATFARICADTRHRSIDVALREEVVGRTFRDWSMGFEALTETNAAQMPGFNTFMAAATESERTAAHLGRAGIFHRVFRDQMR